MKITLGDKIKKIRLNLGLNMEEFGKLVGGANKGLVSKWENNKFSPNKERLELIAELGGIPLGELLENENLLNLIHQSKDLSSQIENSIAKLAKLEEDKDSSDKKFYEEDFSDFNRILNLTTQNSDFGSQINKEKQKLDHLNSLLKEVNELLQKFSNSESLLYNISSLEEKNNIKSIDLESIFNLNANLYINNQLLSIEEKERAIQILKLVFKK